MLFFAVQMILFWCAGKKIEFAVQTFATFWSKFLPPYEASFAALWHKFCRLMLNFLSAVLKSVAFF